VFRSTGVQLSDLFLRVLSEPPPFHVIKLIVAPTDRQILHELIRQRFMMMLEQGLVDEVSALYQRGDLHANLPAIRAVGYRQVWAYLSGEWDYPEMVERGVIATRQFAKRQYTWLRREETASRFLSEDPAVLEKMLRLIVEAADGVPQL
jgi:tRNA dimethylallyltransferase